MVGWGTGRGAGIPWSYGGKSVGIWPGNMRSNVNDHIVFAFLMYVYPLSVQSNKIKHGSGPLKSRRQYGCF